MCYYLNSDNMKMIEQVMETGIIPEFNIEDEIENLSINPNKPSARILQTKIGAKTIDLLKKIRKKNNHSWYKEILERSKKGMEDTALFYRANKITYRQMFEKADALAMSLAKQGFKKGDRLACCMANTPELTYLMLAANKLGITLMLLGTNLDKEYMRSLLKTANKKAFFCTDDNYEIVKDVIQEERFENKIVVSRADSLPEDPTKCDEYEPELDKYYHYDNLAKKYKENDSSIKLFDEYINYGKDYTGEIVDNNDWSTPFTITFTSGSTRIGFPKPIMHCNRSYIVGGVYNATNLTGSPDVPNIRGLAHIHSDSNTNLVTAISDNLMKHGSVALEPEYGKDCFLDYIFINKPVHLDATTSFLVQAAKDYLIKGKFKGRKLPNQLVTMAVGEKAGPGEEKFLNIFLRKVRAGSKIALNGIRLLFGPLSIGGGDCEHGGIYYTLLKLLQKLRHSIKLRKDEDYGMTPVPFSVPTALKQLPDGTWEECEYGEYGIIVANSITTMAGYDGNKEQTLKKIIRDRYGRDWVSCDCYGYINSLGNVVIKGRKEDVIRFDNQSSYPVFMIDDIVEKDTKNILSCSTVCVNTENGDVPVINIEFSPLRKKGMKEILLSLDSRLKSKLPEYVYNKVVIRVINNNTSFPLIGAGKRSIPALQQMGLDNVLKIESGHIAPYYEAEEEKHSYVK